MEARQVEVPAELRAEVSTHGFWNQGTTAMFDIVIITLNEGAYLQMTPKKALTKSEKDKKDLYLQACLEGRCSFTPMVYSTDRIPGSEALGTQKRLYTLLDSIYESEIT